MVADKLTVGELAAAPVVALPPVVAAGRLLEVLASCSHSAFPVTPDAGTGGGAEMGGSSAAAAGGGLNGVGSLGINGGDAGVAASSSSAVADSVVAGPFAAHGLIRRDVALKLLEHRLGFVGGGNGGSSSAATTAPLPGLGSSSSSSLIPRTQAGREAVLCLLEQRPVKSRRDAALLSAAAAVRSRGDFDALVDLRPFMQRHPHVIAADASLSRAYRLFRTLGLRHLLVAPPRPQAVGLITRKDICEANARLALGRKANAGLATASARLTRAGLPFIPYAPYDPTVGGGGGEGGLGSGNELGGSGGNSSLGMQRLSSGGLVGGGAGAGAVGSLSFGASSAAAGASSSLLGLEAVGNGGGGGETRRRGGGSASPSLDRGGATGGSDDASGSAAGGGVEMSSLLGGGGGSGGNV